MITHKRTYIHPEIEDLQMIESQSILESSTFEGSLEDIDVNELVIEF